MAAPKIIVLGSLNGNLEPAFKKLASLHAKNSFALALLTGDVFTPETDDSVIDALLDGAYALPLPTYFTVGTHPLPERIAAKVQADESEICPNLHFLGKRSVTKTSEGLRIVSLGGVLDPNLVGGASKEQHLPYYTGDDAKSLKGANSADILLTASWPAGVWHGSKVALDAAHRSQVPASQGIADLCAALKPRYHISASPGPFFYEREPFVQALADPKSDVIPITRFISMAPYGNEAKQKAIYAFSLNRSDNAVPPGATASPLLQPRDKKRPRDNDNDEGGSYSRYGNHHHNDGAHGGRRQKRHRQQQPPPGPDQCFFCLSNPSIATHMVCSIGDDAYITTAKGPLPTPTTFAEHGIAFPSHFIIIPLPHTPTLAALGAAADPSSEASKAHREMTRFRASLQSMVAAKSQRKLGAVTWEISRDRNVHLIWQLVALPADLIARGLAEAAFRVEADNHKYPAFATRESASLAEDEAASGGGDYFRVWLWCDSDGDDAIHSKTLVMPLDRDARFDLQFARRALAKLLGLERRVVWQDCQQTEEEETKDAEAFREAFKEWDFTLQ
ncbi:hypothetical protein LMH87_007255 [Akanthomyces muscarius]|uniref:CwfJ domain protein n=1 Tax=Akanthomyces muscarius TaxID=2231603 RepID=A0A9W8QPB7_AKAMU|nr:hypothetical protein LMH87_007255 [Akanthomyces muscarius]KAJ4165631.1 hypothetical protein LMH87_007255 [Akanthomyces muscarius]